MKNKSKNRPQKTAFESSAQFEDTYESHKWFEDVADDPKDIKPATEQVLIELKDEAKKCHDSEVANYKIKNAKNNSNFHWMKTVMAKGTVSDKIAAHTVAIQDNPVCGLETLRNLVGMVKVSKKKECCAVIDVLTELFLTDLLRPDQKLKAFHQRPLSHLSELSSGNAVSRRKLLSVWYFEDQLKEVYTSYVLALNTVAHDTIDSNKEKAISAMYKMLAGNPEQEKNLLSYIVNKLGDPSQKVASKAIYSLNQLLFKHSNMQEVVLNEVEKLMFRPNVSSKAQYYGLCFLSQFYLSEEASEVARRLIEVYFSFFKACVKKGEVDSRMMSALLMGVNRAYPYAKLEIKKISEHIDTIYRVVHLANFNIGLHALSLLYQVSDSEQNISNRFYSALYKKLLDSKMFTTTHQAMLLSLIYKALLKDTEIPRVKAFVKRLLQLSLAMQPPFACGILYLISQLMGKRENIQSLTLRQSALGGDLADEDDDEEKYHDVEDKTDQHNSPIPAVKCSAEKEEEAEVGEQETKPEVEELAAGKAGPSWHHCKNTSMTKVKLEATQFDPLNRNPLHAGGDFCTYTELLNLKNHFHPTVSLYASSLLEGEIIKYSGDPLKDFTLIRFLDRFVFKNPKKLEEVRQGAHPTFGKRKFYQPKGLRSIPVNSESYLKEDERKIPVEELFMYRFLRRKQEVKQERKEVDDSDLESVQSDEFEQYLENLKGATNEEEEDEEDLDFMNDIGSSLKTKNKKKKGKQSEEGEENEVNEESDEGDISEDEDDDDDDDGLEDEDGDLEMDDEDRELLGELEDDEDDDEDMVFGESDEEEVFSSNKGGKAKKKRKNDDTSSLFASADEFASLLEDEGQSKVAPGSSNAFANKDNADMKQIAWEEKRNRWLKGYDSAIGKGKKKKSGNFGRKRPHQGKNANNSKRFKH